MRPAFCILLLPKQRFASRSSWHGDPAVDMTLPRGANGHQPGPGRASLDLQGQARNSAMHTRSGRLRLGTGNFYWRCDGEGALGRILY